MAGRPPPRELEVLAKQNISPNMLRITLGGAGLAGFPEESHGGYIKLRLFPNGPDAKPVVRTYTIRAQSADALEVDFVLHTDSAGECGPATDWAQRVQIGETIEIGGPGPAKPLPEMRDFYLIGGDMTAIPAISVNLAQLPGDARGHVAIEVQHEDDQIDLARPEGVSVEWLINPHPGRSPAALMESLRAAAPDAGSVYGWFAAEFNAMRAARDYLRGERGLSAQDLYISSYWKSGETEEGHKLAKREDAETAA